MANITDRVTNGVWVLTIPPANQAIRDQAIKVLATIVEDGAENIVLPEGCVLTRVGDRDPVFTWDQQTPPLTRERRDDDPAYPPMRVINSLTPVTKMGRAIRPLTAIDAEYAVWEVEIEGAIREVHSPDEAWK